VSAEMPGLPDTEGHVRGAEHPLTSITDAAAMPIERVRVNARSPSCAVEIRSVEIVAMHAV